MRSLFCALALVLAIPAGAQDIPEHPDKLKYPALQFDVPDAAKLRMTLPSGAPAYLVEDAALPMVDLRIFIRGGSFSEPKAVSLQRLMMKEVALLGSFCYGTGDREPEFVTAARLTGRWRDELAALTTHQLPPRRRSHCIRHRRRQEHRGHQGHPHSLIGPRP